MGHKTRMFDESLDASRLDANGYGRQLIDVVVIILESAANDKARFREI
jgi:hypothetical protein